MKPEGFIIWKFRVKINVRIRVFQSCYSKLAFEKLVDVFQKMFKLIFYLAVETSFALLPWQCAGANR